jgi:hypothetical protein
MELEKVELSGGKRFNICPSDWQDCIWIILSLKYHKKPCNNYKKYKQPAK